MQDEIRKLLLDIQISANSITDYLGKSKNFNEYKSNKMLRRAVEREFEILNKSEINNFFVVR